MLRSGNNHEANVDVIIIGSGPAGIFAALELVKNSSLQILMIEKGGDIQDRVCPMTESEFPARNAIDAASFAVGGRGCLQRR